MQKALKFLKENIVCGMSLDDMISKDKEPSPVLYYLILFTHFIFGMEAQFFTKNSL